MINGKKNKKMYYLVKIFFTNKINKFILKWCVTCSKLQYFLLSV